MKDILKFQKQEKESKMEQKSKITTRTEIMTVKSGETFTVVKKYLGIKTLDECFYSLIDYYLSHPAEE